MSLGRRKFIYLTGGCLIGSSTETSCGWFSRAFPSNEKVPGIPQQWVDLKGDDVYTYANYILSLDLKNITPRMVLESHFKSRGRVVNDLPPRKDWKKIIPTLQVIDKISCETGMQVKEILSAYRSPKYNRAVRGKSQSLHMSNQAIDVRFKNVSSWRVARTVRDYRDKKKTFEGGIGTYSSFVHIDTRGENVDW